jgi:O-antigen/teichoic acid export membrane protein
LLAKLKTLVRSRLPQNAFARSVSVLVGGTALAQGLGLLALPLLTRFYTPEDFSLLAVYVAILTILGAVSCMRLDAAIPLPESDEDAANLLALALSSAVIVVVLTGLVVLVFGPSLADAIGRPEIAPYLWLVPFGVGLMGFYSSFQYVAVRQKAFTLIARTKMRQAIVGLGLQIGMGWAGIVPLGLLLGHALMSGAGVVVLALRIFNQSAGGISWTVVSWPRMRQTLHSYRRFPQYSVAEDLTNNAGIQLPILLIAAYLVGPEAGLLFLAMRAVGTPMTIVGGAVAQVYYSHAADYDRQGTLSSETTRVFKRLSRLLVLPLLAIGPFAPDLFRLAFGSDWERVGVIVVMMLPWYAFRLIASPISMVMHVRMRQRLMLAMTVAGMALRVLPLLVVLFFAPDWATLVFAITSALFYGLILVVFLKVAGLSTLALTQLVVRELLFWVGTATVSFFFAGLFRNA